MFCVTADTFLPEPLVCETEAACETFVAGELPTLTDCCTVALFWPVVFCCWMVQLCATEARMLYSAHQAVL